jgi:hypothetical protein
MFNQDDFSYFRIANVIFYTLAAAHTWIADEGISEPTIYGVRRGEEGQYIEETITAEDEAEGDDESPCPNGRHEWFTSEETDRCYCGFCGADGDG